MTFRVPPGVLVAAVVAGAGAVALFRIERPPELPPMPPALESASAPSVVQSKPPERQHDPGLPAAPSSGSGGAPTIAWTVPPGWLSVPNPNAMRLATYRAASDPSDREAPEVTVARAGGSTDANIQRWIGQFSNPDRPRRANTSVHGLEVALVEVTGTYMGGGMMAGSADSTPHPEWMLVGAIVQSRDSSYFFKMLGPTPRVTAARKSFDTLVASLSPR